MNNTGLGVTVHHPLVCIKKVLERLLGDNAAAGILCRVLRATSDDLQSEYIIRATETIRIESQQF